MRTLSGKGKEQVGDVGSYACARLLALKDKSSNSDRKSTGQMKHLGKGLGSIF
jgi:hypothetical protein